MFTVNSTSYGVAPADLAIIVCYRHNSTPYGYNDAIWAKYGKVLSQRIGRADAATANPLNPGAPTDRTLGSLIANGHRLRCARRQVAPSPALSPARQTPPKKQC